MVITQTRMPDPQRFGETIIMYEDDLICPICGRSARLFGYVREASLPQAAERRIKMGMSKEKAWDDLSLRMPHDAMYRMVYPKDWYMHFLLPYKDAIIELDKVCVANKLRPLDGWVYLLANGLEKFMKWVHADCAPELTRQLIEENRNFEKALEMDFIEKIMNRGK
jgi:hypothetical protein